MSVRMMKRHTGVCCNITEFWDRMLNNLKIVTEVKISGKKKKNIRLQTIFNK